MINIDFFKKNKTKLVTCGLASIISLTSLWGCANTSTGEIPNIEKQEMNTNQSEITHDKEIETKTFNPGEHIIAKSYCYDISNQNSEQFSYHPGYIIIDIITTFFYQNEKTVECTSNENGEFIEFGTPVEQEKTLKLEKPSN